MTLLASLLCSGPVGPMTEAITPWLRMTALVMVEPMSMPAKYWAILSLARSVAAAPSLEPAEPEDFSHRPLSLALLGIVRGTEAAESGERQGSLKTSAGTVTEKAS